MLLGAAHAHPWLCNAPGTTIEPVWLVNPGPAAAGSISVKPHAPSSEMDCRDPLGRDDEHDRADELQQHHWCFCLAADGFRWG